MTTLADDRSVGSTSHYHLRGMEVLRGPHSMTDGLPADHLSVVFTSMEELRSLAVGIFDRLYDKDLSGNQFLLVHHVPSEIISELANGEKVLDSVPFRIEWDDHTVLIKVVPGHPHETQTSGLMTVVDMKRTLMGIIFQGRWGGTTTFSSAGGTKGKEGDQCFWPVSRVPRGSAPPDWPTLLVETGVSESRNRLHQDVRWWFYNSHGAVRIVIIMKLLQGRVVIEKWQLLPPDAPNPAPRAYLINLRNQPGVMPPFANQLPSDQQIRAHQQITVTRNGVQGAPLIISFHAIFDRAPGPNEGNLVITANELRFIVDSALP